MSISSLTHCPNSQTSSSPPAFPAMATSSARASATSWQTSPLPVTPRTTRPCFGCRGCASPPSPDRQQAPGARRWSCPALPGTLGLARQRRIGPGRARGQGGASSAMSAAERALAEGVEVDLRTIEHRKAAVDALKGQKEVGARKQNDLRTAILVQSLAGVEEGLLLR